MRKTIEERFWTKVHKTSGCWLWTGTPNEHGYGRINRGKGIRVYAHRLSWELVNGSLLEELCVLHKCDTPLCVRPDHLFLGTRVDNAADRDKKGRLGDRKGESSNRAKLTDGQVRDIRSRREQSQRALAKEFGVTPSHICNIRSGRLWAHITQETMG